MCSDQKIVQRAPLHPVTAETIHFVAYMVDGRLEDFENSMAENALGIEELELAEAVQCVTDMVVLTASCG
jgi:hypothetical protein